MKRIGLIIAIKTEMEAVLRSFGEPLDTATHGAFTCYHYSKEDKEIYAILSGAGEVAASAATQILISVYHVDLIGNFGVVGALTRKMKKMTLCLVKDAVHYDMNTSGVDPVKAAQYCELPSVYIPATEKIISRIREKNPDIPLVSCASGDKFIRRALRKTYLHRRYHCDICDMEVAAIFLTAYRNHIPVFSLKTVSDAMMQGGKHYKKQKEEAARICMEEAFRFLEETI